MAQYFGRILVPERLVVEWPCLVPWSGPSLPDYIPTEHQPAHSVATASKNSAPRPGECKGANKARRVLARGIDEVNDQMGHTPRWAASVADAAV
ncbi:hypothetical protein WJX81_000240 [Elliptochloris bilobata]|uniref:Uncharacterized protein n=1 Tax=Elliptochloris bilobata TaxID=381761 RepID=A0AAW1SIE4_9CHLO